MLVHMAEIDELHHRASTRRRLPIPVLRKAIRQNAGESLASVGRAVGVSAQTILAWERGERDPSPGHLGAYLAALTALQADGPDEDVK